MQDLPRGTFGKLRCLSETIFSEKILSETTRSAKLFRRCTFSEKFLSGKDNKRLFISEAELFTNKELKIKMKFSAFLAMFAMAEASDQSKGETYSVHFTHFEYKVVREKSGHFLSQLF